MLRAQRALRWARNQLSTAAAPWQETKAGNLYGVQKIGTSPGLVWAHGLGGSVAADELRGLGELLDPRRMGGRSVLRLDLRGHGRSLAAHDASLGASQYEWQELAKDMRRASQAALSRGFFGGEAMGAAVALHAAVAAAASGSKDAPPGLVMMRPSAALALAASGRGAPAAWRVHLAAVAAAAESGGMTAVEALEAQGPSLLDGAGALYAGPEASLALAAFRRSMDAGAFAAALRGHAASKAPGKELQALNQARSVGMADDAYGVPLTLQCPVLILAMPSDPEHPVEAAEELAAVLPDAELVVSADAGEAMQAWPERINIFLRKAWMKEFLTKRVMPQ